MPVSGGSAQKIVANVDSPPSSFPGRHAHGLHSQLSRNIYGSAEHESYVRQHPDRFAFAGMSRSPDGMSIAVGSGSDSLLTILQVMVGDGTTRELTGWQWLDVRGLA